MEGVDINYDELASDEAIALVYYDEQKKGKPLHMLNQSDHAVI